MPLDPEEEIRAAELRRLNADAGKLESAAKKLDAEVRRFRNTTIMDVVKLGVLVTGGVFAGLKALDGVGWL